MTCIAASRTLRSSCGICWRAFTRMWIRWQVNLSMSPSRMRISASMNASFLWIFHEFSWIYLNMFMDFLFKVLCLTCLMNQLTKYMKHLLHVPVHVYIYFCGFSQSVIYIFKYIHCMYMSILKMWYNDVCFSNHHCTIRSLHCFICSDQDKAKEYWRVYLTYDNSHIVG